MANYELIIERRQPPCGGKDPKVVEFRSVQTDDPVAYVQSQEPGQALEVAHQENGELVVSFGEGMKQVRYCFTED